MFTYCFPFLIASGRIAPCDAHFAPRWCEMIVDVFKDKRTYAEPPLRLLMDIANESVSFLRGMSLAIV
ncbi:unnamed protein product [Urochloa humidicola]